MLVIARKHARPNCCVVSLLDHPHLQSSHLCPVMRLYSLQISSPELQQNRSEATSYPPHFLKLVDISHLHQSPSNCIQRNRNKNKTKLETKHQHQERQEQRIKRTRRQDDKTTKPQDRNRTHSPCIIPPSSPSSSPQSPSPSWYTLGDSPCTGCWPPHLQGMPCWGH